MSRFNRFIFYSTLSVKKVIKTLIQYCMATEVTYSQVYPE